MSTYRAPIEDGLFLLRDVLCVHTRKELPGFEELSPAFCSELLNAAARIHQELLHPLNRVGDEEGACLVDGQVRTPRGFRQAWDIYRQGGWSSLSVPAALGGMGLPPVLSALIGEMRIAAAHSFSMYGAFAAPAARVLQALGLPWMRRLVVPRLVAGDWTATMCMTEADAGTDLRQIRSRAVAQADGSWRLSGSKIFISGGDHDLTDNIVHIVLAKVADENGDPPDGLSAVNAFVVCKRLVDTDTGRLGELNRVSVTSLEHKMGIGGSATCALHFDEALAWRLESGEKGGAGSNMAAMFMLMNSARLGIAMSGVAYAEIAVQNAADYARQRHAGRAPGRPRTEGRTADPIVAHPDVRRLLLGVRAFAEGARATALRVAVMQSVADHAATANERLATRALLELLQPVMKAYFTDKGFEATNDALQVLGGHGYVRENGMEHLVRNARIGQIYEGANGIQALDFVQRRLCAPGSEAWRAFCLLVQSSIEAALVHSPLRDDAKALKLAMTTLDAAVQQVRSVSAVDVAAAAYDLMTATGIVLIGWNWLEVGLCLQRPDVIAGIGEPQVARKQALLRLWTGRELPLVAALCARATGGSAALMSVPDELV